MRLPTLSILAAVAASSAMAQPFNESPPTRTIQCIEAGGHLVPPICQVPASRIDPREFICICPSGGLQVDVALCAKGQRPPPEGKALNVARREGIRDGSLVGDTLNGQPICVAPRGR